MEEQVYGRMREIEDGHWWFVARRMILENFIASLKLPSPCKILDIGSGTGGNLAMLSRFGDISALEKNETAIALAAERKVCPIIKGSLPFDLPNEEQFDLVTLLDILEHIEDDFAALQAVKRILNPDGTILVTVPAFPFLWGSHDERHQHKRRYRKAEFVRLFENSGFEVVYASYFNCFLFPPVVAVRLIKKMLRMEASDDETTPPAWLNRMLCSIFAAERHLLSRTSLPFGLSLLALAKNRPHG